MKLSFWKIFFLKSNIRFYDRKERVKSDLFAFFQKSFIDAKVVHKSEGCDGASVDATGRCPLQKLRL